MSINKEDVLLYLNPLHLEEAEVKNKFSKWYQVIKTDQIRAITILTALLYVIYSQINQNLASQSIQPFMTMLHLYVLPLSLLFISVLTLWERFYRTVNLSLAIAPIVAACGSIYIISNINEFSIFLPELYLIVIWTFSISGLRLTYAIVSALTIFLIAAFSGYYFSFHYDLFLMHLLWLFSAFSFGLLNAFLIEKSHMLTFLNKHQLEVIATIDGLTGLYNRQTIENIISEEIERVERYKRKISFILLDIDYFKNVNDNFGHHIGDVVLKEFSLILKDSVRTVDEIGRWGGEEFIIMLPETSIDEAENIAEHIRSKIESHTFSVIKQKTASFGVSEYIHGDSPQSIINRTDRALYNAKESGRNQVQTL